MLTLSADQRRNVARIAAEPTCAALIGSDTGTGKTVTAVEVARALGAKTVLVIAPPGTMSGWRTTFEGQGIDLPFLEISSKKVDNFTALSKREPGVYFVGREFMHLSATSLDPSPRLKGEHTWEVEGVTYTRAHISYKANKGVKGGKILTYLLTVEWPVGAKVDLDPASHFGPGVSVAHLLTSDAGEFPSLTEGNNRHAFEIQVFDVEASFEHEDPLFTTGRKARWSWSKVKPDLAIYDEVHAVSNRWSNGFKVLKTIVPRFKIAMSATPAGNSFMGIWPVCRWLWPKDRNPAGGLYVDNSQWRWAARWATVEEDQFKGRKVTGERIPGAFVASLPCYVRDEADRVPEELFKVAIELTPEQRRMYDQMQAQSLAWLGENPLVADIPITQRIRLRQMSLGEVSFAEDGSIDFKDDCESAKIDACLKIIARHPGRSIVFWTDSQRFARVLAKRLPETVEWSGAVNKGDRERIRQSFGTPGVKHIAATIAAMSEGVDGLQHVSNVQVWCNKDSNNVLNIQAEGRLNRRGQPEPVIHTYELIALNTADDDHFDNLVKQTVAMRRSLTI